MKKGDEVKHKNVKIKGTIVQIDKPEKGEKPVIHVDTGTGTYHDPLDMWQPAGK